MKWTTFVSRAQTAHCTGFRSSERQTARCSGLCSAREGVVTHYVDSGCVHNPPPSTERGRRRKQKGGNK